MKSPLRMQILIPLVTMLLATVAVNVGFAAWLQGRQASAAIRRSEEAVARVVSEIQVPMTLEVLNKLAALSGQQFVVWSLVERRIETSTLDFRNPEVRETLNQQILSDDETATSSITIDGETYVLRRVGKQRGLSEQMYALSPQSPLVAARWQGAWPPVVLGLLSLAVVVPWLWSWTNRWSSRMIRLKNVVGGIGQHDVIQNWGPDGPDDELRELLVQLEQLDLRLKRLQNELMQTERERFVAQVVAGLAHQIRNGVAGASLAIDVHRLRCAVDQDQSLFVATRQLQLLELELQGLLSLAKRTAQPMEPFDPDELLQDAVSLLEPVAQHRGATLTIERRLAESRGERLPYSGVKPGLRAALLNLLQNGIEAAGEGGRVEAFCASGESVLAWTVRDSGPGPVEEMVPRLFEPFTTSKKEGLGLGLTVALAVASEHGGTIEWRRDGGWTEFILQVPTHRPGKDATT